VTAGLIEGVSPARYLRAAAEQFAASLEDLLRRTSQQSLGQRRQSGALVHIGEIDPTLLRDLQARGFATAAGQWSSMAPELASIYKVSLANEVAKALHAVPATDEADLDVATWIFDGRKQRARQGTAGFIDGFACVRRLDPFPLIEQRGMRTSKVVELRQLFDTPRRAFRDRVQARVAAMDTLPSAEAIRAQLDALVGDIEGEVNAQRRALETSNVRNALKLVTVSTPAALGAAVALAGAPLPLAATGVLGSLGLGATDWFIQRRQARRSTANYLLALSPAVARTPSRSHDKGRLKRLLRSRGGVT
jgi:hypothetical protein